MKAATMTYFTPPIGDKFVDLVIFIYPCNSRALIVWWVLSKENNKSELYQR